MRRWFVYIDIDYYPAGQFVEAADAESAIAIVLAESNAGDDNWAAIVTPVESVTRAAGEGARWRLEQLGAFETTT
jgi:hypothetical protein